MKLFNPIKHWFQKRASALGWTAVAREQQTRYNALFGADPDKITRAVTAFDCGTLAPLARLVEAYERRDDKMMTCSMKMKASVGRCDYSILPREGFEGDARAARHAEILKRFWSGIKATSRFKMNERGGIGLLKKQMMNAQSYGFAVHELVWNPLPNGELGCTFIEIPLWHFENRTGQLRFLPEDTAYDGIPMPEGEWMVTTGDGIGIAAAVCACLKRLTLADWAVYCQRCGMPVIVGKTGAAYGSDQWNNLNAALRAIGRDARIQVDTATDISAINVGGGSAQPYTPLVEWADRAIAALYRGADLSTISQGGGGVGASLQGDETGMLEQDACNRLSETLQEQVERFVIRYVTGDDEPLAHIVIAPASKQNVDEDIKIDQHLVSLGAKLSRNDALQRYGRIEADPDDEADAPLAKVAETQQGSPSPQGAASHATLPFANEDFPEHAGQCLAAGLRSQGQDHGETASNVLAAFAKDTGPAADAIRKLLANPTPEAAKSLLGNLDNLIPDDPALAAVIADAMAEEFGKTVANKEDQPRGKTSADSTPGSFAPAQGSGKEPESKKSREKREKAERQVRHMAQGVASMPKVLAGHDVLNFMPGFKNARISYTHIAFYQGDTESGYIHIKNHSADKNGVFNHQAMLVGDKIPETIAKGTWYDDGEGIRVVYNDRLVILGKDGDGLRIVSAYEAADKAKHTRTDRRFVRIMNKSIQEMIEEEGAI